MNRPPGFGEFEPEGASWKEEGAAERGETHTGDRRAITSTIIPHCVIPILTDTSSRRRRGLRLGRCETTPRSEGGNSGSVRPVSGILARRDGVQAMKEARIVRRHFTET